MAVLAVEIDGTKRKLALEKEPYRDGSLRLYLCERVGPFWERYMELTKDGGPRSGAEKNRQWVDIDRFPEALEFIKENNLGVFIAWEEKEGKEYPVVEFDMERVHKFHISGFM